MRELSEDNAGNLGDGNPYASPGTEQPVTEKVSDPTRSRSSGCLLLPLAIAMFDAYGLLLSSAGFYGPFVLVLGPNRKRCQEPFFSFFRRFCGKRGFQTHATHHAGGTQEGRLMARWAPGVILALPHHHHITSAETAGKRRLLHNRTSGSVFFPFP